MFFVNVLEPGVGLNLSNVDLTSGSEVAKTQSISFENFIEHIVPKSILKR
jgi:Na+/H+-dicarboxylate symporter